MSAADLHGRTALITGACQGVGLRVAQRLAAAGTNIAGLDRQDEALEQAMNALAEEHGVATLARTVDVREEAQVADAVSAAVERFGAIDILVNNAGIRKIAPAWETPAELWDEVLEVNLRGQFFVAREVVRQSMRVQGSGKLVFISSIAGRRGAKHSAAYCASKWGIRGLAAAFAQDLKDLSIAVTVITPGRTDTPMARNSEQWNPDIGWLDADGIAEAVHYFVRQAPGIEIPEIHMHCSAEL